MRILLALLALTALPARACDCVAQQSDPHILHAYQLTTVMLMLVPLTLLSYLVRQVMRWEQGCDQQAV